MKVYRIFYRRMVEAQADIPFGEVKDFTHDAGHFLVTGNDGSTLLALPADDVVTVVQLVVPDQVQPAAPEPEA